MKPHSSTELTLITGASSGIGLALAREFASHGHPLILISPIQAEIDQVAADLASEFGVEAQGWAYDLTDATAPAHIFQRVAASGLDLEILVNNAGLGQRGNFWEIPVEKHVEVLHLNSEAVMRMLREFLPAFVARGRGRVLNTASVAGFEPGPEMAVYHATKAFVLSLTQSLAVELQDTGVTITALCPGPIDTDFFPKADMIDTVAFQKANLMAPQEVATAAYPALMKADPIIVPGGTNKALVFARRFMTVRGQAKANAKLYARSSTLKRQRGDVERKVAAKKAR